MKDSKTSNDAGNRERAGVCAVLHEDEEVSGPGRGVAHVVELVQRCRGICVRTASGPYNKCEMSWEQFVTDILLDNG